MKEFQATSDYKSHKCKHSIFLAGSIALNKAEKWQEKVIKKFSKSNIDVAVFNPRRTDWNNDEPCTADNKYFSSQVIWEMDAIMYADKVLMNFDPNTESPITLLELGLLAGRKPHDLIVVCPEGFWRKGNVDIVCQQYDIKTLPSLTSALKHYTNLFK